jgi:hypothetical protein
VFGNTVAMRSATAPRSAGARSVGMRAPMVPREEARKAVDTDENDAPHGGSAKGAPEAHGAGGDHNLSVRSPTITGLVSLLGAP